MFNGTLKIRCLSIIFGYVKHLNYSTGLYNSDFYIFWNFGNPSLIKKIISLVVLT